MTFFWRCSLIILYASIVLSKKSKYILQTDDDNYLIKTHDKTFIGKKEINPISDYSGDYSSAFQGTLDNDSLIVTVDGELKIIPIYPEPGIADYISVHDRNCNGVALICEVDQDETVVEGLCTFK